MRVSTSMIYNAGVNTIGRQSASLLHAQQVAASGKRIITPSDDPVAAAQAIGVQQASDVVTQYSTNLSSATSSLSLEDSRLGAATTLLTEIRTLAVQAGSASLSASDRQSVATNLRASYNELLSLANSKDATGNFMFAGFRSSTTPFSGSVDYLNAGNEITYSGDEGQQTLQISGSRVMEISDSGSDIFQRIFNGNGTFTTSYPTSGGTIANTGTATISGGSITGTWVPPSSSQYTLRFSVSGGNTTYTVDDGGTTVASGSYVAGQAISFQGATVTVSGTPNDNDYFLVTPSTSQSVFKTVASLINAVENGNPGTTAGSAQYSMDLASSLSNLDRASDNLLRVRSSVGAKLQEVDAASTVNSDLQIQYKSALSDLQDADITQAYSEWTQQKTQLQAALQSFTDTAKLSLFDYL